MGNFISHVCFAISLFKFLGSFSVVRQLEEAGEEEESKRQAEEQVTLDGTKIKACASGKSFRREETLQAHLEKARERLRGKS